MKASQNRKSKLKQNADLEGGKNFGEPKSKIKFYKRKGEKNHDKRNDDENHHER